MDPGSRVVDPNAFNVDPDPKCWPNLDPDPGYLYISFEKTIYKKKNSFKKTFFQQKKIRIPEARFSQLSLCVVNFFSS